MPKKAMDDGKPRCKDPSCRSGQIYFTKNYVKCRRCGAEWDRSEYSLPASSKTTDSTPITVVPRVVGGLKKDEKDIFIGPGGGPVEDWDKVIGKGE